MTPVPRHNPPLLSPRLPPHAEKQIQRSICFSRPRTDCVTDPEVFTCLQVTQKVAKKGGRLFFWMQSGCHVYAKIFKSGGLPPENSQRSAPPQPRRKNNHEKIVLTCWQPRQIANERVPLLG